MDRFEIKVLYNFLVVNCKSGFYMFKKVVYKQNTITYVVHKHIFAY